MLEEFTITGINGKANFDKIAKTYNVNMESNARMLHHKDCKQVKSIFSFIPFDSYDEVLKFEKHHKIIFNRCQFCMKQY